MKHIDKLLKKNQKFAADTLITLPVAKDHGYYAGILYCYLQDKQSEQASYVGNYNMRNGIRWIPKLTNSEILADLPVFPDIGTLNDAIRTLRKEGLILTETTGAFLEQGHATGRKRDIATWWHVSREYVAKNNVPSDYFDKSKRQVVSALEAVAFGISVALILGHWRARDVVEQDATGVYKRLSAVELEKVLPMDERTVRRNLKYLVNRQILFVHRDKPKLYRLKQ